MVSNNNKLKISAKMISAVTLLSTLAPGVFADSLAPISSFDVRHGHAVLQVGYNWSSQGRAQNVNIVGLVGDRFTLNNSGSSNGLVGLGYYVDGQVINRFNMSYGLNAFFLAKTSVGGYVIQEQLYENLAYGYQVYHFPLYAMAKSTIDMNSPNYALTVDAGIGPNFMTTSTVNETSLDGITLPDKTYAGRTNTTFSATVGVGMKFNKAFGVVPLECGYRFFYLGQGSFKKETNQLVNTLSTGSIFGNAVICSVII